MVFITHRAREVGGRVVPTEGMTDQWKYFVVMRGLTRIGEDWRERFRLVRKSAFVKRLNPDIHISLPFTLLL